MKNCTAGHKVVLFGSDRCPVCAAIDWFDKALLKADARIAELECEIEWRRWRRDTEKLAKGDA